ncbi:MAG: hypothetical protein BroJett039_09470 [Chloroflexota bacterium]|nr:MAG: hypothetical protein BroJett039_09470 [Chloroflexota bacterium]
MNAMPKTFAASSSLLGSIIANSYRRQAMTDAIVTSEVKRPAVPKASAGYRRARMGRDKTVMACAIVVPPANFMTSNPNSLCFKPRKKLLALVNNMTALCSIRA